jgi:outer membrane protein assembly factor BamB
LRRHRKLLILAAVVLLLLGGGVAAAYLIATRPVADVHNGLSDPFTSTPEPTTSTPVTPKPVQRDWGPAWPMYGREPSHSRDAAELTGIKPPFLLRWQKSGHGVIEYPPSYVDGVLYLASDSGWVAAYKVTNGDPIWGRKFVKVLNQPAVSKGRVYFGSYDRRIYCLNAKTGHTIWKKNVGTDMESPPTVAGGRVYMGGLDGTVRAVDQNTGRIVWTYHTSGPVKGAVTLAKGRLYFGDYAGVMYSIRASNGGKIWSTASNGLSSGFRSGQFYSTPNVRYGRVYVGNTDGKLYSFVASNGHIAWTHTIDGWVYGSPATWNGLVFDTGYDGSFEAMDARTGNVKWSVQLPYGTTSSPTVIGNYVYVASHGRTHARGNLWAYNPRNGHRVWHFNDGWYSTVVNGGTNRLIVAGARNLYMLRSR